MSLLPGTWLLFSLTYARGNYREFIGRWRFALAAAFIAPLTLAVLFRDHLIVNVYVAEAHGWVFALGWSGMAIYFFSLITYVLVLTNLERTYRASVGTMRWRIKYVVLGLGVLFAARIYTSSQCLLFRAANPSLQMTNSVVLMMACLLILRAAFRSRHFEVSVYPSHAVLHHSLTILLTGVYLLIVGVFAKVVTWLGGDASFTLKTFIILVSLVLLSMLLLSDRARVHTKRFVSRHFQRPLYNYATVWRSFTEGTASHVQQKELCQAVVKLVSDIFQVLSVTIWVIDAKREELSLAASSSLSDSTAGDLKPMGTEAAELVRALRIQREPVDIETTNESWAETLKKCHPIEFRKGGHRICVPMSARDEILGLMVLGDRVAGIPFSTQDFDLLKCVGGQAAANLLNLSLSQRLMQARELEAFQTMSAFFVHDLKNTASTLSLMLQNFPLHYHDPAFREDALRGIGKSVHHINDLIRRLTLLRQELAIKPAAADLNQIVAKALEGLEGAPHVRLARELQPLPRQILDAEQLEKVVLNLLLNAKEASNGGGEIRVTTGVRNNWTVLSVTDNGCGMTREFVERSLFRPFQTTKKNGIGIGMFQSKMIVEAHHGKIEVETSPDSGTTFRVLLPLVPDLK